MNDINLMIEDFYKSFHQIEELELKRDIKCLTLNEYHTINVLGERLLSMNELAEDLAINRLRQQQVMSRIKISDQDVENFLKTPQGQAAIGSQAHILHLRVSATNNQNDMLSLRAAADQVKQDRTFLFRATHLLCFRHNKNQRCMPIF